MPRARHRRRFDDTVVAELAAVRGIMCRRCGRPIDLDVDRRTALGPTVNHIVAWADGGTDDIDNLELMHSACNKAQGRAPVVDIGPRSRQW